MNLFNIAAALTLNSADYEKGLTDAEKRTANFGKAIGKGFKAVGTAVAAVGTAAAAAGVAFYNEIGQTAEYGDNIDKMSQKIGISAEAFQEWDFILQHSGASVDALKPIMKSLTQSVNTNAEAFAKLGISQEQALSMSREELFEATIAGLQSIADENERAALATETLGRGAQELGALLNTSAEDTAAMKQQVHDLGGVMSDDGVKNAAAYQDSLQNLKTATSGLKRSLMTEFMPALSQVYDGLALIFSGGDGGLDKISEGINNLSTQLLEKIPEFLPVVTQIIESVGEAAIENLPLLAESLLTMIGDLCTVAIDNLPLIFNTLLIIIENIATHIGESLPTLIPAIVEAIVIIAQTLVEHLPELLGAVLEIIRGLAKGILDALPIIIDALPDIILGIINFIIEAIPQIIRTGVDLISSLVKALPEIISNIVAALPEIITGIIDALLDPDNLQMIIEAGIELLVALIEAIPEVIVALVEHLPDIIIAIVEGLLQGFGKIVEVGGRLLEGIWQGIKDGATWLWNKIKGWAEDLLDSILGFFGIHSPSTVMRDQVGKNIALGLGDGISKYGDIAVDAMDDLANDILDAADIEPSIDMDAAFGADGTLTSGSNARGGVQVVQNIYAQEMSPAEVFEEALNQQERWYFLGV